jgi:hypothetical protein
MALDSLGLDPSRGAVELDDTANTVLKLQVLPSHVSEGHTKPVGENKFGKRGNGSHENTKFAYKVSIKPPTDIKLVSISRSYAIAKQIHEAARISIDCVKT